MSNKELAKENKLLQLEYRAVKKLAGNGLFRAIKINKFVKDLLLIRKTKRVKQFKNQAEFRSVCEKIVEVKTRQNYIAAARYQASRINSQSIKNRLEILRAEKSKKIEDRIKLLGGLNCEAIELKFNNKINDVKCIKSEPDWNYYSKKTKYPKIHHTTIIYFKASRYQIYQKIENLVVDGVIDLNCHNVNENGIAECQFLKNGRGYSAEIKKGFFVSDGVKSFHGKTIKSAKAGLAKKISLCLMRDQKLRHSAQLLDIEHLINEGFDFQMFKKITISTKDVKEFTGACAIGISSFCAAHRIGKEISLVVALRLYRKTNEKYLLQSISNKLLLS